MSRFSGLLNRLRIGKDSYDEDDEVDEEIVQKPEQPRTSSTNQNQKSEFEIYSSGDARKPSSETNSDRMRKGKAAMEQPMELCVFKATRFEDTEDIVKTLLAHKAVVLNVDSIDLELAQRILDLIYGACYAIEGKIQKVSQFIFLVTPKNVTITGNIMDKLNTYDFTGNMH